MGKKLQHSDSIISMRSTDAGCMWGGMWGALHFLKYHHWRHIKKRLPYKRSSFNKPAAGDGTNASKANETRQKTNERDDDSTVHDKSTHSKGSVRSRLRALIMDELYKRKGRHRRSSTYPAQSHLGQTDSIHHLEHSERGDLVADTLSNDRYATVSDNINSYALSSPDPSVPKFKDNDCEDSVTMLTENHRGHVQSEEGNNDVLTHHSKEILDALSMINMNQEFFLRMLHDPGSPFAQHFYSQQACNSRLGYSKSDSFPLPGSSRSRGPRPSKSKQKQDENENFSEERKSQADSQMHKSPEPKYREYVRSESMPSIAVEHRADGILKLNQAMSEITPGSSPLKKRHGQNPRAIRRFKDLKQKIQHVISESKKEKHRIAMDAILHKVPHCHGFSKDLNKEIVDHMNDHSVIRDTKYSPRSDCWSYHSLPSMSKTELPGMSRTSSFNESLERYCQLYETTFNREAKTHRLETLKLRTEDASPCTRGNVSNSMERTFSLPDLKFWGEDSSGAILSNQVRTGLDGSGSIRSDYSEHKHLGHPIDARSRGRSDLPHHSDFEVCPVDKDQLETISISFDTTMPVPDHKFQEFAASTASYPVPEAAELELGPRHLLPSKLDSLEDRQAESGMATPTAAERRLNKTEFPSTDIDTDMLQCHVDTKDRAEFDYVRDILELSGFSGNELLGTWHSDDQPVDPSVLDEVEGCMVLDPKCTGNEEGGNCDHLLLFDLINEVLMEIYGKSYAYYPKPLSSLSHVRPMPVGYHVLEEVWASISWYLSPCPEADHLLDYAVSRDLAKSDGWMKLQFDTECVGLELEDLILEDLLEEVICTN